MYTQVLLNEGIPLSYARTLSAVIERWDSKGIPANALDRLLVEEYQKTLEKLDLWRNGALVQTPKIYYEAAIV